MILNRWPGTFLLRKYLFKDVESVREGAVEISEGRALEAEGTASTKAVGRASQGV